MITIVGMNPITLDVYLSDGQKVSARDFYNVPKVGYGVKMLHDIGYEAIPIGEVSECVNGCPIK